MFRFIFIGLFIFSLQACSNSKIQQTGEEAIDQYDKTNTDPTLTGVQAAPILTEVKSRVPDSDSQNLYLDIKGDNFGGTKWAAQLKNKANNESILLVTADLTKNAAKLIVDSASKLVAGTYDLIIENAYGATTSSVTTLQGNTGPQGLAGPAGPAGAAAFSIQKYVMDSPDKVTSLSLNSRSGAITLTADTFITDMFCSCSPIGTSTSCSIELYAPFYLRVRTPFFNHNFGTPIFLRSGSRLGSDSVGYETSCILRGVTR